jgi:hypothetical protein
VAPDQLHCPHAVARSLFSSPRRSHG